MTAIVFPDKLGNVPKELIDLGPSAAKWLDLLKNMQFQVYHYELVTGTVASVGVNTTAEVDFTISGVTTADIIFTINKPTHQTGLGIVGWRVKAANTISITYMNATAGGIVPSDETYDVIVGRIKIAS